jgi:fucose 4-O-acetylase-like acetyltransferase
LEAPSSVASGTRLATRLVFVDHLRVALTVLVVVHHLAVIYGANAAFYYVEPPYNDPLAFVALTALVLVDQAFFMGLFFLISGYFVPASFDRKGPRRYLQDRLLRLGVPLLVFVLVLNPIASIGIYQMPAEWTGVSGPFTWQQYPQLLGVGPMWFVEMLLIFDILYVAWRWLAGRRTSAVERKLQFPGFGVLAAFAVALAVVSFALRVAVPLGLTVPVLGFPTLAYLPQYASFFVIGTLAARRDWFRLLPGRAGVFGIVVGVLATLLLFPLALSDAPAFVGGGHWQSAVYALWDSVFAVGVSLALIAAFRRWFNQRSASGEFLSRQAYAVYVIHVPIVVLLALALRGVQAESLVKFGLAAVIGVPLCFGAAFAIRKLPLASRVF